MTQPPDRRRFLASLAALSHAVLASAETTAAEELRIEDAYSARDRERAERPRTDYIILHTTEAGDSSSLHSVQRYGSCHYLILVDGRVLRIIHRDKIANHAGRSMWDGVRNLSTRSIGIEIVGHYTDKPRPAQLAALKEVLRQLQDIYGVADKDVLTHSQIAYSYHSGEGRMVRGRRKDAIQFADPAVRMMIGLEERWEYDPDEEAGRVAFQDYAEGRWLRTALYDPGPKLTPAKPTISAANTEPDRPKAAAPEPVVAAAATAPERIQLPPLRTALAAFADTKPVAASARAESAKPAAKITTVKKSAVERDAAAEETDDPETFEGFQVLGVNGNTVEALAGKEALSPSTIYILPDGRLRSGDRMRGSALLKHPPKGLKVLIGYVIGGEVTRSMHAIDIAGAAWNYPSTFYRLPDLSIRQGDKINESAIPPGTIVLYRH